jgi:KaiC/GvpD/RAD55 family RecA-like ATPase
MTQTQTLVRNSDNPYFSRYGKQFQEGVFQGLLTDHIWSAQMIEVMEPSYFDIKYLSYLADKYFNYYSKYKTFPTLGLLITIVKDDLSQGNDSILRDQIVEYLHRVKSNPNPGDQKYVKDKSLDFCKRQAFKEALEQAVELISSDKFESVVGLMKEAVAVGMPSSVGHDFFEDAEARFVLHRRAACPTGLDRLDKKDILQGGLGSGELGVITANTGVGKSHFLVALGANAMRIGKNVLHYTFELSETAVGIRYDSNLCDIASNDVQENKELVMTRYKDSDLGRLIIKEFPTGSASVVTIRNHIEKLSMKGFKPSVIMVDYADVMRSTRQYDSMRHELKLIYEELRNLSMELSIPIWTASQANRDSAKSDVVGLENMAEAYGKAMVADVVISLSRKPMEKSSNTGRLFIAKNRAGRDGLLFPIHIDTSQSKIVILDEKQLTLNEVAQQDESDMKSMLKAKWKEISNDRV